MQRGAFGQGAAQARCGMIMLIFGCFLLLPAFVLMGVGWGGYNPGDFFADFHRSQGIVGIVLLIAALTLICVAIVLCYKYKKNQQDNPQATIVQPGPVITGYTPGGATYPMTNAGGPQPAYPPGGSYQTGPQPPPGTGYQTQYPPPAPGYQGQYPPPAPGYQGQPPPGPGYQGQYPPPGPGYQGQPPPGTTFQQPPDQYPPPDPSAPKASESGYTPSPPSYETVTGGKS